MIEEGFNSVDLRQSVKYKAGVKSECHLRWKVCWTMMCCVIVLTGALMTSGCTPKSRSKPSAADLNSITNLVGTGAAKIEEMQLQSDGTVLVTMHVPGESGGDLLTLNKTNGNWFILRRGSWMN